MCVYTITLELILSKIPRKKQRPRIAGAGQKHKLVACLPTGRARAQKISLGCGAKGNFLCPSRQAEKFLQFVKHNTS